MRLGKIFLGGRCVLWLRCRGVVAVHLDALTCPRDWLTVVAGHAVWWATRTHAELVELVVVPAELIERSTAGVAELERRRIRRTRRVRR